jgi:hypothetical protein
MEDPKQLCKLLYQQIKMLEKSSSKDEEPTKILSLSSQSIFDHFHLREAINENVPSNLSDRYKFLFRQSKLSDIVNLYCSQITLVLDDNKSKDYSILHKDNLKYLIVSDNSNFILIPKQGKEEFVSLHREIILKHVCSIFFVLGEKKRKLLSKFLDEKKKRKHVQNEETQNRDKRMKKTKQHPNTSLLDSFGENKQSKVKDEKKSGKLDKSENSSQFQNSLERLENSIETHEVNRGDHNQDHLSETLQVNTSEEDAREVRREKSSDHNQDHNSEVRREKSSDHNQDHNSEVRRETPSEDHFDDW